MQTYLPEKTSQSEQAVDQLLYNEMAFTAPAIGRDDQALAKTI